MALRMRLGAVPQRRRISNKLCSLELGEEGNKQTCRKGADSLANESLFVSVTKGGLGLVHESGVVARCLSGAYRGGGKAAPAGSAGL